MDKKKKIIIIVALIISVLLIIAGIIVLSIDDSENNQTDSANQYYDGTSKLTLLSEKITETKKYKIIFTLNDENQKTITKNNEQARIEILDSGNKKTYTIKNGNTYLKTDDSDEEFEYKNNTSLLNDFENNLNVVLAKNYIFGTEKIEDKNYTFEEYSQTSAFVLNYKGYIDEFQTKTRFYFDGNELKYIKTCVGDVEQLLKIDLEI